MLRMSTLFLRTLREDPADAEVPSHRLLVRAGYVRRVAPGIYSWLPLGVRMLANVSRVVREEMDRIGAQEVLFPALLPREPYEASGRWTEYGDLLFRLKDRRGNDYLLGPTHEELFTLMVKGEYSSYKDLPVILYQVQTKYRDEARPRAGILRGREFVMKDSYSFDLDDEGLQRSYDLHREAYVRTFERLGMDYRIVSAVSGAMGGSASEEFLAPAPTGEDTFVSCTSCDYAANTEAVDLRAAEPSDPQAQPPMQVLDTPDTPTIDTLVAVLKDLGHDVPASGTLKNVVVLLRYPDGKVEPLVVGVPGDREVDVKRLEANVSPPRCCRSRGSTPTRSWSRATSARRGSRASATSSTRSWSAAARGRPAPTSRASTPSTWSWAATSSPPASCRRPRCARATPAAAAAPRWRSAAASRSATSSSSAASTPTPSASTCSARTASRSG